MSKINIKNKENIDSVSRKEALKKMGRFAALTAAGTFLILNPLKSQANSGPPDPGGGGGIWININ
ncbi:MAG: hypothetical protein QMC27_06385 [Flavobacteriaceae bacterium]|jgi:hypothetical protein|tara:strand:+ start:673 stop:867 length:195 start_codon:yes stop_codon:yes gene_type:complete